MSNNPSTYDNLISEISSVLREGRKTAMAAENNSLVQTYWLIGKHIVEFEQEGKERADYGSNLMASLSKDLRQRFGKGFSKSNMQNMRLLFLKYQKTRRCLVN